MGETGFFRSTASPSWTARHGCRDWVRIIMDVRVTKLKRSHRAGKNICDDLLNLPDNWMKNIVASGFFLWNMSLYFTLRAILQMFKFSPEKFVLTFLSCSKKVSQSASGRRAGRCLKSGMDSSAHSTYFLFLEEQRTGVPVIEQKLTG